MKHEWRKKERELYLPKTEPVIVDVPEFKFLSIRGTGNPNSADFARRVEALYTIAYGIRMSQRAGFEPAEFFEYTVYPLEGVWDLSEEGRKQYDGAVNKDELVYQLMIRQPAFVRQELFDEVLARAKAKTANPLLEEVVFEKLQEGRCAQLQHMGSFDDEPVSFAKLDRFCEENRLRRLSLVHREIYLSDPRKTVEIDLKTVLRIRVEKLSNPRIAKQGDGPQHWNPDLED